MTMTLAMKKPCARCPRVDEEAVDIETVARMAKNDLTPPPALKVFVDGAAAHTFAYLCGPCREIVDSYLSSACKTLQHKSSTRDEAKEEEGGLPPPLPGSHSA